jgi:serralysin
MGKIYRGFVPPAAISLAVALFLSSASPHDKIRTCTELFAGHTSIQPGVKGAGLIKCMWPKGTKSLRVYFLDGDSRVRDTVKRVASEWTPYSGIAFNFGNDPNAEIRITFTKPGSWSYIGACQWDLSTSDATMNFGWLTPDTSDEEYHRVVLHEFGHALGLVHEHQNPVANIPWNETAVYAYYQTTQHWSREQTHANVLEKYSEGETNRTAFDRNSIMLYSIPGELTTDGVPVGGWNTKLSALDEELIHSMYN